MKSTTPRGARQSRFERKAGDYYKTTDPRAYEALGPFLAPGTRFFEPCAGDGALVRQLEAAGHVCVDAFDIEPRAHPSTAIRQQDALQWNSPDYNVATITNPPYAWPVLKRLLPHFMWQSVSVWLLLEARFMFNDQSGPFMRHCMQIVSVRRLKWEEDSAHRATIDHCWYHFGGGGVHRPMQGPPAFYGKGMHP